MKFSHRAVMLGSMGFGLGVIVGPVISALSGSAGAGDGAIHLVSDGLTAAVGDPLAAFIIQAFVSGLYGVIAVGGSAVYGIEKWSLLRCTAIHYLSVIIGLFVAGFSLRWFDPADILSVLIMIPFMTVPYIMIWLINFYSSKKQIKEINRELERYKAQEYSE